MIGADSAADGARARGFFGREKVSLLILSCHFGICFVWIGCEENDTC